MTIYLTEADVDGLLNMEMAVDALDEAFKARARGEVFNSPRSRLPIGRGSYNFMAASWPDKGIVGHKSYTAGPGGARFHVAIYSTRGEGLLLLMEASRLGQIRTGAASGVATRYMANQGELTVGVIGSGYQAETQLEAIATACHVVSGKVFSRNEDNRNRFAKRMSERLGIAVDPADSGAECADGVDVLVAVTNSVDPVITGNMVAPGMHINAAGNNSWLKRELDTAAIAKCDVIAVDDVEQAKYECGELMRAAETGRFSWDNAIPIHDVVAGNRQGRGSPEQITLFESQGLALEDLAVADIVYKRAMERGAGITLPG
jgi:alanine dehydrogenase